LLFLTQTDSWRELLVISSLAGASDKPANEMTETSKEASHISFIGFFCRLCLRRRRAIFEKMVTAIVMYEKYQLFRKRNCQIPKPPNQKSLHISKKPPSLKSPPQDKKMSS
jgi:hypothetical protein